MSEKFILFLIILSLVVSDVFALSLNGISRLNGDFFKKIELFKKTGFVVRSLGDFCAYDWQCTNVCYTSCRKKDYLCISGECQGTGFNEGYTQECCGYTGEETSSTTTTVGQSSTTTTVSSGSGTCDQLCAGYSGGWALRDMCYYGETDKGENVHPNFWWNCCCIGTKISQTTTTVQSTTTTRMTTTTQRPSGGTGLSSGEICSNGVDDDGDGYTDLDDSDCCDQCISQGYVFDSSASSCSGSKNFVWEDLSKQNRYCCGNEPYYKETYIEFTRDFNIQDDCDNINDNRCINAVNNPNDAACCDNSNDCVFNNRCYESGTYLDVDSNGGIGEICLIGYWIDPDASRWHCIGYPLSGYRLCQEGTGLCWVYGGELSRFGEFNTGLSKECCGDDIGEKYIDNLCPGYTGEPKCCKSDKNYINIDGYCVSDCSDIVPITTTTSTTTTSTSTPSTSTSTTATSTTTINDGTTTTTISPISQCSVTIDYSTKPATRICVDINGQEHRMPSTCEYNNGISMYVTNRYICQVDGLCKEEGENPCIFNGCTLDGSQLCSRKCIDLDHGNIPTPSKCIDYYNDNENFDNQAHEKVDYCHTEIDPDNGEERVYAIDYFCDPNNNQKCVIYAVVDGSSQTGKAICNSGCENGGCIIIGLGGGEGRRSILPGLDLVIDFFRNLFS